MEIHLLLFPVTEVPVWGDTVIVPGTPVTMVLGLVLLGFTQSGTWQQESLGSVTRVHP